MLWRVMERRGPEICSGKQGGTGPEIVSRSARRAEPSSQSEECCGCMCYEGRSVRDKDEFMLC